MLIKFGEFDDDEVEEEEEAAPHDEEDREKTDTVLFDDSTRCERSFGDGAPDDVVETDAL